MAKRARGDAQVEARGDGPVVGALAILLEEVEGLKGAVEAEVDVRKALEKRLTSAIELLETEMARRLAAEAHAAKLAEAVKGLGTELGNYRHDVARLAQELGAVKQQQDQVASRMDIVEAKQKDDDSSSGVRGADMPKALVAVPAPVQPEHHFTFGTAVASVPMCPSAPAPSPLVLFHPLSSPPAPSHPVPSQGGGVGEERKGAALLASLRAARAAEAARNPQVKK